MESESQPAADPTPSDATPVDAAPIDPAAAELADSMRSIRSTGESLSPGEEDSDADDAADPVLRRREDLALGPFDVDLQQPDPLGIQEVHGVDDERDIGGVLTDRVREILEHLTEDGSLADPAAEDEPSETEPA